MTSSKIPSMPLKTLYWIPTWILGDPTWGEGKRAIPEKWDDGNTANSDIYIYQRRYCFCILYLFFFNKKIIKISSIQAKLFSIFICFILN